jgi:PAS domain S-box-containing protein
MLKPNYTSSLTPLELKSAIVRDPLVVAPDTTVMAAIAQMSGVRAMCDRNKSVDAQIENLYVEVRSSCVIVVEEGRVIGILTERDVVRLSAQQQPLHCLTMRQAMVHPIVTLHESTFTDLFVAVNLLQQHHIRHLPILDEQDCLVGIVTHESLRQTSRPIDLLRLRLVAEVMNCEVVCATPDCLMLAIAQQMAEHRVSSVVIVESSDSSNNALPIPLGILTERDLVQFQALGLNLREYTAQSVMSTPTFAVKPKESLWNVQQMMDQYSIRRLVVTGQQGELLGIVTQTSLLQALNPLELYNLAEVLEKRVVRLEAEKVALLESRTVELEQQVETRTAALRTKAEREKLLVELATQIRSSLSLQTILDTTVEQVRLVLGCDRVNIWQFKADWTTIAVAESTESTLSLLGKQINDTCLKQGQVEIYKQGHIRIVPDIYTAQISDCHREMLIQLQTRAKILVPLLCGDQLWGLLNATESQHARSWEPEEVELLQALSVQLAIALQQATIHQKLQEELSERRQAEIRLRESEQKLQRLNQKLEAKVEERTQELWQVNSLQRAILNGADYSIISTDPTGIIQTFNPAAEQMLDSSAAEMVGKVRLEFIHDRQEIINQAASLSTELGREILPGFEALVAKACQGISSEDEWTYIRKGGSRVPVLLSIKALKDTDHEIIGFLCIAKNITQWKQAEAQLQEQEQFLRSIYDGVAHPIFVIDVLDQDEFIYVNWNAAAKQANCASVHEIVGRSPEEAYGISSGRLKRQRLQQCLTTGLSLSYEERTVFSGQEERWWLTTLNPLKSSADNTHRIIGTMLDISDRKQAESQLQQTNEELARATRLKDEFLANMSHELRTPLNAILGMTEGLQEAVFGKINDEQIKSLQTIERSGFHLLELINDILDVAKIEAGQIELDCAPTAVAPLCQSSLAFIKQQALKKRIQLEVKLPPHLPNLFIDERRIRQVLINLLNNAVKFTPEGGRITLETSYHQHRQQHDSKLEDTGLRHQSYLRIAIVDTGIGIAPEHISRLFQPFIQIDSALNRQYTGTGLGLALVKRIVELHGGQVGLTSRVGVGSCFTINLPCIDSTSSFIEPNNQLDRQAKSQFIEQKSSPLILLAEDNEANISTLSSYLIAKGYCILLARNGQEAIDQVQSQKPDLILMDIQMPGMDGLEAIQQIRSIPNSGKVPIIALTALAMSGDCDRCLAAGANDYLSKPVKLKQLVTTIQQYLSLR